MTSKKPVIQALKMEKNIPFIPTQEVTNIIVFGCGGTGSAAIPHITRLINSIKGTRAISLTLIDGDVVEEKNLIRQNFTQSDIGRNKAEVNAARYAAAFGIPITFQDKYVETSLDIITMLQATKIGAPLIVCCVDNIKTRASIKEAVDAFDRTAYWVDCGNEEASGQVVFSARVPAWKYSTMVGTGTFPLPDVFDLYPDLWTKVKTDKFASELSCAEMAVSTPQLGHVNLTAAVLAMNFIHALVYKLPINTHVVEFNIKNKFAHRTLNASTIESWKTKCSLFRDFSSELL